MIWDTNRMSGVAMAMAMAMVACDGGGGTTTAGTATPTSTAKTKAAGSAPSKSASADVAADEMGTFVCANVKDDACVGPTDTFKADAAAIHLTYKTRDIPKSGDVYHIAWIAEDVGKAAPANTVIRKIDKTVDALPDIGVRSYVVNAELSKPDKGWPIGKYRVEITLADKVVTTARFTVE
jgi:hypothetical protein